MNELSRRRFLKISIARYFGGTPSLDGKAIENNMKLDIPKLKAPAKVVLKRSGGKKKREGC